MLTDQIDALLTDATLWPRDENSAAALQHRLAPDVRTEPFDVDGVSLVAGLDVCYATDDSRLWAAAVVLDARTWDVVESIVVESVPRFEYIPGLFAFRELPSLLAALARLTTHADVLVCDGAGQAHPRRFGLASHLGVLLDMPTIGSAKTRLFGTHHEVGPQRGDWAALRASDTHPPRDDETEPTARGGEIVGRAIRTRDGVKPVYASVGHRVDLDAATRLVLRSTPRYRLPEPIRAADHACGQARAAALAA